MNRPNIFPSVSDNISTLSPKTKNFVEKSSNWNIRPFRWNYHLGSLSALVTLPALKYELFMLLMHSPVTATIHMDGGSRGDTVWRQCNDSVKIVQWRCSNSNSVYLMDSDVIGVCRRLWSLRSRNGGEHAQITNLRWIHRELAMYCPENRYSTAKDELEIALKLTS